MVHGQQDVVEVLGGTVKPGSQTAAAFTSCLRCSPGERPAPTV